MLRVKSRRWLLAAAVLPLILAACTSIAGRPGAGTGTVAGSGSAAPGGLGAVRHVWVIELENQGYQQSFGTPAADPYLARTLPRMGALLENYYAIGHSSADNYIAQVSGQAPDIATQIDCPVWTPFPGQVIAGPAIMAAPAYRDGGLIVITFDEGSDAAACCGETAGIGPSHPNVPLPGKTGPGGGRTGAVLLSPLIRPGTVSTVAYNHYSLLRSIEDIFALPHLGAAAMPQVRSFGPDVFAAVRHGH